MDGLTEGRIVHYVPSGGFNSHRAAVVTHIWSQATGCVNLHVFPDGSYGIPNTEPTSILYDEAGAPGTWHWIEKA